MASIALTENGKLLKKRKKTVDVIIINIPRNVKAFVAFVS